MEGKKGVTSGKATNKVALPSVNCFFGSIGAVDMGRCKLEGGAAVADERFQVGWAFVVKDVEQRLEATVA
jgi:hypothetical protein